MTFARLYQGICFVQVSILLHRSHRQHMAESMSISSRHCCYIQATSISLTCMYISRYTAAGWWSLHFKARQYQRGACTYTGGTAKMPKSTPYCQVWCLVHLSISVPSIDVTFRLLFLCSFPYRKCGITSLLRTCHNGSDFHFMTSDINFWINQTSTVKISWQIPITGKPHLFQNGHWLDTSGSINDVLQHKNSPISQVKIILNLPPAYDVCTVTPSRQTNSSNLYQIQRIPRTCFQHKGNEWH